MLTKSITILYRLLLRFFSFFFPPLFIISLKLLDGQGFNDFNCNYSTDWKFQTNVILLSKILQLHTPQIQYWKMMFVMIK